VREIRREVTRKNAEARVNAATARLQSKLAQRQKQIEALTAGLQKVSAQLELSKPAPQVINNNQ